MKKIILRSLFVMGMLTALTQTAPAQSEDQNGFEPIEFEPIAVPDAGSSAMLLGAAIGGIAMVRKFWH